MTAWTDLPGEFLAGVDPAHTTSATAAAMHAIGAIGRGESYLAWQRYQQILTLVDQFHTPTTNSYTDDGTREIITRIARQSVMTRYQAELWANEALTLRDRLPQVATTLRDGLITRPQLQTIIHRTDLIDDDTTDADGRLVIAILDNAIADLLRNRPGTWTTPRLRDMVDRLVFQHDPDAVRERRRDALDKRGMWTTMLPDGTGELTAVMSAEDIRIAAAAVRILADSVCPDDGRPRNIRNSDATFALLTRTPFDCHCGREDCTATTPDPDTALATARAQIVIHVVTDAATLTGAPGIGWIDGHGIITDDHVRDLAARPDATTVPVTPTQTAPIGVVTADDTSPTSSGHQASIRQPLARSVPAARPADDVDSDHIGSDGTIVVYPGAQPADPYRPTTACDTFVRIRDGYCTEPGCTRSAFTSDLDHVTEYDHTNPAAGEATSSENLNAKCRAGHLHKTHSDWVDLQYRDTDGRLVTEYITPEGIVLPGDAETLEDHFPNLRRIRFEQPAQAPPTPRIIRSGTTARRTTDRTAAKHARRRLHRARNTALRDANQKTAQSAPRHTTDDDPPPF